MATERAGQHIVSAGPLPSRPPPPPPPPAGSAELRRIEEKLDWLHAYLTTVVSSTARWPHLPPWPEKEN